MHAYVRHLSPYGSSPVEVPLAEEIEPNELPNANYELGPLVRSYDTPFKWEHNIPAHRSGQTAPRALSSINALCNECPKLRAASAAPERRRHPERRTRREGAVAVIDIERIDAIAHYSWATRSNRQTRSGPTAPRALSSRNAF